MPFFKKRKKLQLVQKNLFFKHCLQAESSLGKKNPTRNTRACSILENQHWAQYTLVGWSLLFSTVETPPKMDFKFDQIYI